MPINPIGWCSMTFNPVIGCENNCPGCYMHTMGKRFPTTMGDTHTPHEISGAWEKAKEFPYEPQRIFVGSCSDISQWPRELIGKIFRVVEEKPQHTFIFLTKDPLSPNYRDLITRCHKYHNAIFGVTIRNQEEYDVLCKKGAFHTYFNGSAIKMCNTFISYEPMLGPLYMHDWVPDWIVIGSMTGSLSKNYPIKREWIESICRKMIKYGASADIFMKDSIKDIAGDLFVQRFIKGMSTKLECERRGWGTHGSEIPDKLQSMINEHYGIGINKKEDLMDGQGHA